MISSRSPIAAGQALRDEVEVRDNGTTSQLVTQSYAYNTDGFLESQTDGLGNTTQFEYNDLGWVTFVNKPNGESTWFDYDAFGNRTELVYDNPLEGNGETSWVYDALNRPVLERAITDDGSVARTWEYLGNTVKFTDRNGVVHQSTYSPTDKARSTLATKGTDTYSSTTHLNSDHSTRSIDVPLSVPAPWAARWVVMQPSQSPVGWA